MKVEDLITENQSRRTEIIQTVNRWLEREEFTSYLSWDGLFNISLEDHENDNYDKIYQTVNDCLKEEFSDIF